MTLSPASGPGHPNGRWGRLPNASHLGHLPCPFFAVSPIPVHSSSSPFPARLVPVPNPARPTLFSYPPFALFPLQKRPRPSVRPSQSLRRRPASHSPPRASLRPSPRPLREPLSPDAPSHPLLSDQTSFSPSLPFARGRRRSICTLFRSSLALLSGPRSTMAPPSPCPLTLVYLDAVLLAPPAHLLSRLFALVNVPTYCAPIPDPVYCTMLSATFRLPAIRPYCMFNRARWLPSDHPNLRPSVAYARALRCRCSHRHGPSPAGATSSCTPLP